ncbi:hypothetical protein DM860_007721 [Cuscuta australis]|uniref:UspA domain-containing protein n=1 Tax=Cuscuta australis TaxID=267555 RepID=A0A328E8V0_9ASTE|nr:hypothetical protein DM860_007721 [Cuscuta australis]
MEKIVGDETSEYACPGEAMQKQPAAAAAVEGMKTESYWKVMVALDDSGESFYALQWALRNLILNHPCAAAADATSPPAMLTLVNVQPTVQPLIYPLGPYGVASTLPMETEGMKKAQEDNAAQVLSRALQICKESNVKVKVETLVMEGDAKDTICEAAEAMHIDVLVVGSRGLGKIKRAFLGSVSDYCAHHARCPVLIVKPPPPPPKH